MISFWWLAMPVLLLPIWWHRQRRQRMKAVPLATARFLPAAAPQQLRVWEWTDRILLLVRCLLLAALIAWLADLVLPWRGDTVLVTSGTDPIWLETQVAQAKLQNASHMVLPKEGLGWLAQHEREWRADARLLVVGAVPMPALVPQLRHAVEVRSKDAVPDKPTHHVSINGPRAAQWQAFFATLYGKYAFDATPGRQTELIVWDAAQAPPAAMHAPLWWIGAAAAFPALAKTPSMDSPQGRLWLWPAGPPTDAASARQLYETWQRLHVGAPAYTTPSQVIAATPLAPFVAGSGALRDFLSILLTVLFALERILAHVHRR
ncbi:MAG: BatA domain-containing protein [Pseudomonadota bacterium]